MLSSESFGLLCSITDSKNLFDCLLAPSSGEDYSSKSSSILLKLSYVRLHDFLSKEFSFLKSWQDFLNLGIFLTLIRGFLSASGVTELSVFILEMLEALYLLLCSLLCLYCNFLFLNLLLVRLMLSNEISTSELRG